MDFSLTEEQLMFRDLFRDFAQKEVAKVAKHTDEMEEPPVALLKKAAAQGLLAERMEILRWGGQVHHLDVFFCRQSQKSLQARAGMLRAGPFKAMRQEQYQAAQTLPLGFAANNVLINDDLSAIGEVAKLCFPDG